MAKYDNLVFVDVEATGISPVSGSMTEFGAVHFTTREFFHGILFDSIPSPANPAIPLIRGKGYPQKQIMQAFADWLGDMVPARPVFVSDNPAYDFQWINYYFDKHLGMNPFGHSGRRIADFWAGTQLNWSDTQRWKTFRVTPHDHNPVNDSLGNVEAFGHILRQMGKGSAS